MSPRETIILCAARKMFEQALPDRDVSAVIDDEVRTANNDIKTYYAGCSQRALKMLDTAVLKRLRYLKSLVVSREINNTIIPYLQELPQNERLIMAETILYPAANYVADTEIIECACKNEIGALAWKGE